MKLLHQHPSSVVTHVCWIKFELKRMTRIQRKHKTLIDWAFLFVIFLNVSVVRGQETSAVEGLGSYEISSDNQAMVKIPFEMHRGKPLMELEINGQKATLMIDNGVLWDEVWLFGSPLVKALDLLPEKTHSLAESSSDNPSSMYSSENLTLSFKDIAFTEQPVLISPFEAGYADMFPFADGQICNTFFKNFIVEFDFIQNEIILHKPDDYITQEMEVLWRCKLQNLAPTLFHLPLKAMRGSFIQTE